jgi:starch-binding outer membrane protein, SusD/RagB family
MNSYMLNFRRGAMFLAAGMVLVACNANDQLLKATDPDIINPTDLNSPDGAEALRVGALGRLKHATVGDPNVNEGPWLMDGLLVDEYRSGDTFIQRDETDQRNIQVSNSFISGDYRFINRARVAAVQAIAMLRKYPNSKSTVAAVGQMFFVKGFAELQSALDFCNGQPFAIVDLTTGNSTVGDPISVVDAFKLAAASFDSAIANDKLPTGAVDNSVLFAAQIGKGRALLGIGGQGAAAAAAVAGVPTNYSFNETWSAGKEDNQIWALNISARRLAVQDSVDELGTVVNALPFVSAKDPRVPTSKPVKFSFDGVTLYAAQGVWPLRDTPVSVVNGIDARLIEAEAAYQSGNYGTPVTGTLAILNALRAAPQTLGAVTTPAMTALTDPGSDPARLAQLFREKAFWTFGRGQRLGDLRRLIRQYSLPAAQVFPGENGQWFKSGNYGHDVNFPVPQTELNNPNFHGCTDRAA